jgi:hypothetical protein
MDPVGRHVALFNQGVRTGDFGAWLSTFRPDAALSFTGLPIPPASGRAAIGAVYAGHPPSSPMRLAAATVDGDLAHGRFVWVAAPATGGEFTLHLRDGAVAKLEVRLDAPPPPPPPPQIR